MSNIIKFLFVILFSKTFAQEIKRPEIDFNTFVSSLAPIQNEDVNYEEFVDNLYNLYQNPIEINNATADDLRSLFFLSEDKINAILKHRGVFGSFLSLYELQSVDGLDMSDIRQLLPFITIRQNYLKQSINNRISDHYLVLRADQSLQPAKGYNEDKYVGSPQRYYLRYRLSHANDYSIGFVSEKDAGEKSLTDFYNFHLQLQNKGKLKNIVVGDYLMQFGQGLVFSAGYVAGKGSEPVYVTRRNNLGIKPYNSVVENTSFRGVANTLVFKNIEVTTMVSQNQRDGSVSLSDSIEFDTFSSIITSGYHRTASEIDKKNAIKEQNFGGNILYKVGPIQVGFSALSTVFDKVFQKRDQPYNLYEFTGKRNFVAGPNFSINWQNFNFFGEGARSSSGGMGYVLGTVGTLSSKAEWALNIRNYQPDFHSAYAAAFSEGSRTINEKGVYTGLKYTIKKGLVFSTFFDSFNFPWLRYRVDAPSSGYDYQLRLLHQPTKTFSQYLAFHHEQKERNLSQVDQKTSVLGITDRNNLVYGVDYLLNKTIRFQTKIQYNNFLIADYSSSHGFAFIQDVEAKWRKIQLKTRAAYFNTSDYDSRVYAYENDVLYAVSFPAYYGKGMRYYAILKMPVYRKLDLWFRIAHTQVSDRNTLGSGNDAISGNKKTDVKMQLKYGF